MGRGGGGPWLKYLSGMGCFLRTQDKSRLQEIRGWEGRMDVSPQLLNMVKTTTVSSKFSGPQTCAKENLIGKTVVEHATSQACPPRGTVRLEGLLAVSAGPDCQLQGRLCCREARRGGSPQVRPQQGCRQHRATRRLSSKEFLRAALFVFIVTHTDTHTQMKQKVHKTILSITIWGLLRVLKIVFLPLYYILFYFT